MAPLPRRVIGNYEEVTYPPLNANCVVVGACSSKFRIHARKNLLPRTDCFGPGDDRVANFRSLLITAHQESGTEIGKCNCKLSRRLNSLCTPLRMVLPISDCNAPRNCSLPMGVPLDAETVYDTSQPYVRRRAKPLNSHTVSKFLSIQVHQDVPCGWSILLREAMNSSSLMAERPPLAAK